MKRVILLCAAVACLLAQDAVPQAPAKTVEQQLAEAKQEIALQKAKVQIYEQALATCQDAHIDVQARRQAVQLATQPQKPQEQK